MGFILDTVGNEFQLLNLLSEGAEGKIFAGKVVNTTQGNPLFSVGDNVVIKSPKYIIPENLVREQAILSKTNSLLGVISETDAEGIQVPAMVLPLYIGETLQKTIYQVTKEGIAGKNELTIEQKNQIAYSLIIQYYRLQLLGIVHCDLKTDNILYDALKGLNIIDFGNSVDLSMPYRHDCFQGPGYLYEPPETNPYDHNIQNSFLSDGYSIGVIITSLYTQKCYEGEDGHDPKVASSRNRLAAHIVMTDILGPKETEKHRELGMPDELYHIVKHLTRLDPAKRPQNIALARGVKEAEALSAIHQIQKNAQVFLQSLEALIFAKLKAGYSPRDSNKIGNLCQILKDLHVFANNNRYDEFNTLLSESTEIPVVALKTFRKEKSLKDNCSIKLQRIQETVAQQIPDYPFYLLSLFNQYQDLATLREKIMQYNPLSQEYREIRELLLSEIDSFCEKNAAKLENEASDIVRMRLEKNNRLEKLIEEEDSAPLENVVQEKLEVLLSTLSSLSIEGQKYEAKDFDSLTPVESPILKFSPGLKLNLVNLPKAEDSSIPMAPRLNYAQTPFD